MEYAGDVLYPERVDWESMGGLDARFEVSQHPQLLANMFAIKIHIPYDVCPVLQEGRAAAAERLRVETAKVDEIVHEIVQRDATEFWGACCRCEH
jgi:hypothetical protein